MAQPFGQPCDHGLIEAELCPRELGREIIAPRKRMVLTACVLASSMTFIDGSALTVALPRLRAFFDADLAAVQWILNSYVLALAALTLIGGALGDVFGKSRILMLGCLGFGATSAACIFAPSVQWLILARTVQGISAALLTPTSLALIGATYPKEERNSAIGVWAAASAVTTAGGPVLGGWLTQDFGWQYVFSINLPLALIAVALLVVYAPPDQHERRRFDLLGATILAAALAALAWSLSQIGPQNTGAASEVWIGAAATFGIATFGGYAWWEQTSRHPMTPPWLLNNRTFVALNLATLLIYSGLAIMFFLMSFDLIDSRHLTPTEAGLTFLPFTLGVALLSRVFGRLADNVGTRVMLIAGPLGAALAYGLLAFGKNTSFALGVLAPMTLLGISFAALVAPLTSSVMSSVRDEDEGLASGVNNTVSRIAQLAGIAFAAGVTSLAAGFTASLIVAAVLSLAAALATATMLPRPAKQHGKTQLPER